MADKLLSAGLDIGTTSTQIILSELTIENQASAFSVPEMEIAQRKILYKSPVHFTPLLRDELVDGEEIRKLVAGEYAKAGIRRQDVDTGAIIITGETSRKENAETVLQTLSDFAGDFVVATAGPDLESILAAKGAGAVDFSAETGRTVLHMDIGGGTSNLARIENGRITATGCLNVGGRLLKLDPAGRVTYISPVLTGLWDGQPGQIPTRQQLNALAETLVSTLEMVAGLQPPSHLLQKLQTKGASPLQLTPDENPILSFSGGVADCIDHVHPYLAFGDLGPILGQAIRRSRLCAGEYRLGAETIRATVIGAGSHSVQLSGSTVFHQNMHFPLKNLPVVTSFSAYPQLDKPGVLAISGKEYTHYHHITALADQILGAIPTGPLLIAMETDMAKALGHALALRCSRDRPILCLDRVKLNESSFLDVGAPVAAAFPVVVKTLILNR